MTNKKLENTIYRTLSEIEDEEDIKRFFNTFLSSTEITKLENRWSIMKLIYDEMPQRQIVELTSTSISTVSRAASAYKENRKFLERIISSDEYVCK